MRTHVFLKIVFFLQINYRVIGADGIRSSTLSQYYKLLNTIQQQKQLNKKLSSSKKLSACTTTKLNNNNNNLNNDAITHLSNNSDVIINDSKRSLVTNISNTNDHSMQEENKLTYLKIFLILGITSYKHSFLTKRGFYTLDGTSRMFTMPFDDNRTMVSASVHCVNNNNNIFILHKNIHTSHDLNILFII